ncbi:MAG TPA: NAD(P)-dependent oxidoreductase [Candidatus Nitrosotalea sp.]|jgi:3-hydroxyisobutyrate dehydrogenase-like beta-hydroxyacid dehydrogenase|nr:NAD(P)-dependent oxidoreductase [Candidatus Nitrosotalea sp.]
MTTSLGFVGLGAMGGRMARRLIDAGYTVHGYNRTASKAADLVRAGMRLAASPREVAERAGVVFTMVTDDAALEAVTRGPQGLLAGLSAGAILVEMSTVSPAVIHRLVDDVAGRGAALLDAPVSGSPATLESGQLSFMVGGDPAVLDRARPFLLAIGPTITHVGPAGLAKSMKIAVNQGLAIQMLSFAEAVVLAEKAGIDRERAVEVLLKSVVASPMVKYRGPFVLGMPAEAWFDVDMIQKDLRLALDMARATGVTLPSVSLTHELLTAAKGLGLARYDFAVIFDVIARLSGLPPSKKL